jgi:glycosyltransferase involved in cell wall biosynthesis
VLASAPRVAAVIPARNEASTVGAVVYAALDARSVDEVIVVDNASTDSTSRVAAAHGARVVVEERKGKGEAMRAGALATEAEAVVFLDADLVGLRAEHVDDLVEPVLAGQADMTCGLFDRGPVANPIFLEGLPVLTGQRALRRDLFLALDEEDLRGYRVEAALNALVAERELCRIDQVLPGLWHRTKEEKLANPVVGFLAKTAMLITAIWSYAAFATRDRRPAGQVQGFSRGSS